MWSITFFFLFIPILSIILLVVNLILSPHNPYEEKKTVFECGFHSFLGQNRSQFNISFFIFALLFLLFDLEILLIYPYSVSEYNNGIYGLIIMLIFFILLTLGFIFELGKGALTISSKQIVTVTNSGLNYLTNNNNKRIHKSSVISLLSIAGYSSDIPESWKIYFQNNTTTQMESLVELHNNIMFYLFAFSFIVGWILLSITRNYYYKSTEINSNMRLNDITLIEFVCRVIPALIFFGFTVIKSLSLMNEAINSSLTILTEEDKSNLNYEYSDFIDTDEELVQYDSYIDIYKSINFMDSSEAQGSGAGNNGVGNDNAGGSGFEGNDNDDDGDESRRDKGKQPIRYDEENENLKGKNPVNYGDKDENPEGYVADNEKTEGDKDYSAGRLWRNYEDQDNGESSSSAARGAYNDQNNAEFSSNIPQETNQDQSNVESTSAEPGPSHDPEGLRIEQERFNQIRDCEHVGRNPVSLVGSKDNILRPINCDICGEVAIGGPGRVATMCDLCGGIICHNNCEMYVAPDADDQGSASDEGYEED